jgi:hypothetical protein
MIRVNDGATRVPHEACLRRTPDPMIGYTKNGPIEFEVSTAGNDPESSELPLRENAPLIPNCYVRKRAPWRERPPTGKRTMRIRRVANPGLAPPPDPSRFATRPNLLRRRLHGELLGVASWVAQCNVEMIRANDGAPRAPHEACLRRAPDPVIG